MTLRGRVRRGHIIWGWYCGDPECSCDYGYIAQWAGGGWCSDTRLRGKPYWWEARK
jgi:hypothetical protein